MSHSSHGGAAAGSSVTPEVKAALDDFLNAFEHFKASNDERLAELEQRSGADVLLEEKVERLGQSLDLQKKNIDRMLVDAKRPSLGIETGAVPVTEHKAAWNDYMRKGLTGPLEAFEVKALSGTSDPEGGYVVPKEVEESIDRVLAEVSPIRSIASVRQIGASSLKKAMSEGGAATGWVAENASRPETATPTLSLIEFPAMELYAMPAATQSLLDDGYVDLEAWVADEVQTVFAEQEGAAFVNGDGVARPRGFLSYDKVDNSSYAWGKVGYVATGTDGGFDASNPSDDLIDLIYTPKQGYRANARFVMNRSTQGTIRKFKDADGNYIWQPGIAAGQPATLMGYPVVESEDMPAIASDSFSIAFGDFSRGYLVVDRAGIRILRDPYSSKPFVLFYTTKRVGGGIQNFEAIKLMKFGTS